jgi:hypothetical protein
MDKIKNIITRVLLVFALISIGFAMGKHSVKSVAHQDFLPQIEGNVVAVYYLHSTFRCVTCNTIEKMTRELLETSYSKELADGDILWIEDDFQENEGLAKQFEVIASCVVVAHIKDEEIVDYKRLDEVWTLIKDPEAFNLYISDAIDKYLKEIGDTL